MTCELFPNCGISFDSGKQTKDGKTTHRVLCSRGLEGSCDGLDFEDLIEYDVQQSSHTLPRIPPVHIDEFGRKHGPSWERPKKSNSF